MGGRVLDSSAGNDWGFLSTGRVALGSWGLILKARTRQSRRGC